MEEHTIKVAIADRVYPQKVSEDREAAIRKAARNVDEVIRAFTVQYREVSQLDIATIVALNAEVECIRLKEEIKRMESQFAGISADLQKYVDSLK